MSVIQVEGLVRRIDFSVESGEIFGFLATQDRLASPEAQRRMIQRFE